MEIVPRPGRIHVSDFAAVTLSDIEGTIAARSRSKSDGFYLLERQPSGEYRLELDPQQVATLKSQLVEPPTYTLGDKSSVMRKSIYVKSTK